MSSPDGSAPAAGPAGGASRAAGSPLALAAAWASILLVSDLPAVVAKTATGAVPSWLDEAKLAVLVFLLLATIAVRALRPLHGYALVLAVFFAALAGSDRIGGTPAWRAVFDTTPPSFARGYAGVFLRDLGVAGAVIVALLLVKRRRADCFLVRGDWRAPFEPVPWLGIRAGDTWAKLGWIFGGIAAVAVAIVFGLALKPSGADRARALPLLPAGLVFAAVNAFTEEVYFRATLLATLPAVVGRRQALLMNVVLFGMAHWLYGSPSGIAGFLMTGFLAWVMGKAMLETKGLAWPWTIHFLPDAVIFAGYAVAWFRG
jgi:membrane protease YdiL (CAAX protease family)